MNLTPSSSPGITRRHLLRQVFAYSAAAALANRIPLFGAPAPAGATAATATTTAAEGGLNFLMLGDFGNVKKYRLTKPPVPGATTGTAPATAPAATTSSKDGDPNAPSMQGAVAAAMQGYVQSRGIRPEGLFMLGDNFYGNMPGGVASERWKEGF